MDEKYVRVTIIRDYGTHTYPLTVERDGDLFCPDCGKREVWVEYGDGDYYAGAAHYCGACHTVFHMPYFNDGDRQPELAPLWPRITPNK